VDRQREASDPLRCTRALDDTPRRGGAGGGFERGLEHHRLACLDDWLVGFHEELTRILGVAGGRGGVVAYLHFQRHLCASRVCALEDGVCADEGSGRQEALDRHRGLQLPVDELVRHVAEAGYVVLVVGQGEVDAADVTIREGTQRAAAVIQLHHHMIAC